MNKIKRKIIQLAGKTHVISLPSKWVRKYDLKKSQELDITEKGRELIVKAEGEKELQKIEFDTKNLNERSIRWSLSSLHKKGYDEIDILYDSAPTLSLVQELLKDLFVGFVIINQTKTRCTIKSISKDSAEEFDPALRRAFQVTLTMGKNLAEAISANDLSALPALLSLEKTNNQLTNFCERLLNKTGCQATEKTCFYYIIIWNLEKACDNYKYICDYLLEQNTKNIRISKELQAYLSRVNELLEDYYSLFYKFDLEKISSFSMKGKELITQGRALQSAKSTHESIIAGILINMITNILDFIPSTIAIHTG